MSKLNLIKIIFYMFFIEFHITSDFPFYMSFQSQKIQSCFIKFPFIQLLILIFLDYLIQFEDLLNLLDNQQANLVKKLLVPCFLCFWFIWLQNLKFNSKTHKNFFLKVKINCFSKLTYPVHDHSWWLQNLFLMQLKSFLSFLISFSK